MVTCHAACVLLYVYCLGIVSLVHFVTSIPKLVDTLMAAHILEYHCNIPDHTELHDS